MSVSRITTAPSTPTDLVKPTVKTKAKSEEKPKKTAAKKPAVKAVAEVDIFVPHRADYRVLTEAGLACTAMLNQTNLAENNNKFFLIQALERIDGTGFASWFRWGRVGYSGQTNLQPFTTAEEAVGIFTQKFYDKTLNEWSKNVFKTFKSYFKKYTLLAVDTLTETAGAADGSSAVELVKVEYEPSQLEDPVFNLVKLISSKEMFETELRIAGLDLTKMPLGRISTAMISEGFRILKAIEQELLGKQRREVFAELSGKFYTVIPHNFGFAKAISFVINSFDKLRDKTELLESLENVKEGIKSEPVSVDERISVRPNPVDQHYRHLGVELETLRPDSSEFQLIAKYKQNTQGETHTIKSSIKNVYKLSSGESAAAGVPPKRGKRQSKMLLWHGSRLTNWMSILTHGLKVAPPEAPHTGYMFGKGIYTADCFSKAANYCFVTDTRQRTGLVVLCEVDVGTSREVAEADYDAGEKLGREFHSTKGVGKFRPDPAGFERLDELVVPCGMLRNMENPQPQEKGGRSSRRLAAQQGLLYNEYVVYDPERVRMKYLVELEFTR